MKTNVRSRLKDHIDELKAQEERIKTLRRADGYPLQLLVQLQEEIIKLEEVYEG